MTKPRFLLDEHIWIERNGYVLVTENRRTIPGHLTGHVASGHHVPGVLWLRPRADNPITSVGGLYDER